VCAQCYATGASLAGEAAMLIGGPIAYAAYRKARRALGLPDTAVAPTPPRAAATPEPDGRPDLAGARWREAARA
jgi:hypothetical protein